jgi:inactivated superfamily I helicase
MAHEPEIPTDLEMVLARLRELEVVLGKEAEPGITEVRAALIAALAARDRGDVPDAMARIGHGMDCLAALADRLDANEAVLMRGLAQRFRTALLRGDETTVRQSAAVMFEKSGAVERKHKG